MGNLISQTLGNFKRSNRPSKFCCSTKDELLAPKFNPLHVSDDCPVCQQLGVLCAVGCHPSTANAAGTSPKHKFKITQVRPGCPSLQEYIDTGNRLKKTSASGMDIIESGLTDFVDAVLACASDKPAIFAYLDGSSGLGKTQLAFALKRKVVYIPQGNSQPIYKSFDGLRVVVAQAVQVDLQVLREANMNSDCNSNMSDFSTDFIKLAVKDGGPMRFVTVQLLLKLLELFSFPDVASAYDTNVFLGADVLVVLEGMTLDEGRIAAEQYREMLIHIDEVPMKSSHAPEPFLRCLLLRNIIRCMGLPCLLSGTESTLLDVVELGSGSRRVGCDPWAWLLTSLPATTFSEPFTELTRRCTIYERHLLRSTRPLFAQWFAQWLTETDSAGRTIMTPATLTRIKEEMCMAKQLLREGTTSQEEDYKHPWLHASTLLVFADSLKGSSEVSRPVAIDGTVQVGAKRPSCAGGQVQSRKKQKIIDDVLHHTLVIRKHFALLYTSSSLLINNNMTILSVDGKHGVCGSDGRKFAVRAAFPTCAEDPLLYLAGLREGLVCRDSDDGFVTVPSSYAFSTFRQNSGVGNRLAKSNDGTALEAECMAALVLAAHRYTSFAGTPFFLWLARVIAELNHLPEWVETEITGIPEELATALKDVVVPLLSPPNSPWGQESVDSGINFGNFSWCKNLERRDASAPLCSSHMPCEVVCGGRSEGEDLENDFGQFLFAKQSHGYTTLGVECKDVKGFGGKNMTTVTTKTAEKSVTLLIGSNLSDWKKETVQTFPPDVSVYRMNKPGAIVCVSPPIAAADWQTGRKVLIALDLKGLYPGKTAASHRATDT